MALRHLSNGQVFDDAEPLTHFAPNGDEMLFYPQNDHWILCSALSGNVLCTEEDALRWFVSSGLPILLHPNLVALSLYLDVNLQDLRNQRDVLTWPSNPSPDEPALCCTEIICRFILDTPQDGRYRYLELTPKQAHHYLLCHDFEIPEKLAAWLKEESAACPENPDQRFVSITVENQPPVVHGVETGSPDPKQYRIDRVVVRKVSETELKRDSIRPTNPDQRPVILRGENQRPIVLGIEKKRLTKKQYKVVDALVRAGEEGLSLHQLKLLSGEPRGTLKTVARDRDWARVIHMAGLAYGRYRIGDPEEKPGETHTEVPKTHTVKPPIAFENPHTSAQKTIRKPRKPALG
jgi:hypothetical protein